MMEEFGKSKITRLQLYQQLVMHSRRARQGKPQKNARHYLNHTPNRQDAQKNIWFSSMPHGVPGGGWSLRNIRATSALPHV